MSTVLPSHLEAFVLRHFASVAHLEALLWMREHRERWWNAESLGDALGIPAPVADKVLEELCSGNLLAVQVSSSVAYKYNPATEELEAGVTQVVDAIRRARVRVYNLIISPNAKRLRDFADAFRLRDRNRG